MAKDLDFVDATFDRDLLYALKRAGVELYWSLHQRRYVLRSKFKKDFSVSGADELSAFTQFGLLYQKKSHWRAMADEILSESQIYTSTLDEERELPLGHPIQFWTSIIIPTFFAAYKANQYETVERVYAFIEWSLWNESIDGDTRDGIWTANLICFFENLPDCPQALKDIPNWFPYHEINFMFEYPPMAKCKQQFDRAYGI